MLYEVITSGNDNIVAVVASESDIDARVARFAAEGIEVVVGGIAVAQAAVKHGLKSVMYEIDVITSYSIHYTKLYENTHSTEELKMTIPVV